MTMIEDLKPGRVDDIFLIQEASHPKNKTGKTYLRMTLADKSGTVTALNWEPSEGQLKFKSGEFVRVIGTYNVDSTYGPQIKISKMGPAPDDIDLEKFKAPFPNDWDHVASRYMELLDIIDDPLRIWVSRWLGTEGDEGVITGWWDAPAATSLHQNYAGGLAEHSVQVADIASYVAEQWFNDPDHKRHVNHL